MAKRKSLFQPTFRAARADGVLRWAYGEAPQPSTSPSSAIAAGHCASLTGVTGYIPRAVAEMFSPQPDYFLTVEGDSMDRLGLTTGTLVAIKGDTEPTNGWRSRKVHGRW